MLNCGNGDGYPLRSMGLTREIGVSRFLDMVQKSLYGEDQDNLPHPIFHFVGAGAQPGRSLGLPLPSIHHIKGCPSTCHVADSSRAPEPVSQEHSVREDHIRRQLPGGVCTGHFTPGPSAVPATKLGLRACMAAISDTRMTGSGPARLNMGLAVGLSRWRSGTSGREVAPPFRLSCLGGKWPRKTTFSERPALPGCREE